MNQTKENSKVALVGTIASNFVYSHETYGEKFYMFNLNVERLSGVTDSIPVVVSERMLEVEDDCTGVSVYVSGHFRSFNKKSEQGANLILSVFAMDIEFIGKEDKTSDENQIYLDGYICKEPVYRKTPIGKEITDLILAVNRPYGKSDYIPCICWGRNARFASKLNTGSRIQIEGRIQSREYTKKLSDEQVEERIAYEVSVSKVEVVEDEK